MSHRDRLFGAYESLFGDSKEEGEEPDDLRETAEETAARLEEEQKQSAARRRQGWYTMAYVLAGGDVTRMERVLASNAHMCFTHLAFERTNKKVKSYVKG